MKELKMQLLHQKKSNLKKKRKNDFMIGNDLKLDEGIGTCGKNGQGVPVGVGQPSLLMEGITIGGTETN